MKSSPVSAKLRVADLPLFAKELSLSLRGGDVISLSGPIGSGKTTFTRVLMQVLGMKSKEGFSSPTFTILNQYRTRDFLVNHVDLYRLAIMTELADLDILPQLGLPGSLTLIEWGDKFGQLAALYTKRLHFDYAPNAADARVIRWQGF